MTRTVRRPGFSLVELLVVIGIVAVLIGLLVPAIQRIRAAAALTGCTNNLKQIGLAAHQFHNVNSAFPSGVQDLRSVDGYPFSSWLTHLLPCLEQQALWDSTVSAYAQTRNPRNNPPHVGLATVVPVFACPSDGRVEHVQFAPSNGINVALTSYLGVLGTNLKDRGGVLYRNSHVRIADITDGTSNTLFAGERPPSADFQYGWWDAGIGQGYPGSLDMIVGAQEINVLPAKLNSCPAGPYSYGPGSLANPCDIFHFWSLHAGGGNFLLADGSVRFVSYGISTSTLTAAATISRGDT